MEENSSWLILYSWPWAPSPHPTCFGTFHMLTPLRSPKAMSARVCFLWAKIRNWTYITLAEVDQHRVSRQCVMGAGIQVLLPVARPHTHCAVSQPTPSRHSQPLCPLVFVHLMVEIVLGEPGSVYFKPAAGLASPWAVTSSASSKTQSSTSPCPVFWGDLGPPEPELFLTCDLSCKKVGYVMREF